jgi:hypothetical protein
MPLKEWARTEVRQRPKVEETPACDDLRELMERLTIPPHVAGVTYPRGVRIRRVRVPAQAGASPAPGSPTVILSRRALEDSRSPQSR